MQAWASWAEFQTLGDRQLENMLEATAGFAQEMRAKNVGDPPPAGRWLSLVGTSGAGKTFLARRIWKWFNAAGKFYTEPTRGASCVRSGQWCDWRSFMEECMAGDFSRTADLRSDWFVVFDDIGAKRDKSGMGADKLDTILSARGERWTMITSNLSLNQIADQFDQRIASRMIRGNSVVIDVDVMDFNLRKK